MVENEIEIDADEGTELFHAFAPKHAATLDTCLQAIDIAAEELRSYVDVIIDALL